MSAWGGLIMDHLWQSTAFSALAALLVLALRRHSAAARHVIWCAASVKFLVPFAALAALGARVNIWAARDVPPPRPAAATLLDLAAHPFTQARFSAAASASAIPVPTRWLPVVAILAAIWLCGVIFLLMRRLTEWRQLRTIRRDMVLVRDDDARETARLRRIEARLGVCRPLAVAVTSEPFEPGVVGVLRPALLWSTCIGDHLNDDELDAVLAHEVCHVRRYDNLTALIHIVVEALFWFHPIVWWMGARLTAERERACDEYVLRLGYAPVLYAAAILKTCRLFLGPPLAGLAGVAGSDLKGRIDRLLHHPPAQPLTWRWRGPLGGVAACALLGPVLAGAFVPAGAVGIGGPIIQNPRLLLAWAPRVDAEVTDVAHLRFAKASLTVSARDHGPSTVHTFAGGRMLATAATARDLIRIAYAPEARLFDYQLIAPDNWISRDRFDLRARAGHDFVNDRDGEPREFLAMLRNFLADRFALVFHHETRAMPIYALVRAHDDRLGPSLHSSRSRCWRPGEQPVPATPVPVRFWCATGVRGGPTQAVSMAWLAMVLSARSDIGRPVEDRTGLTGEYDLDVTPTLGGPLPRAFLEDRFGLRLEPRQGFVNVLVVDQIERPVTD